MAERRMFARSVIRRNEFLNLPLSTQALYFQIMAEADDEGFVGCPSRIRQMVGASNRDLTNLYDSGFLINFPSGVAYVKDWQMQNSIRKDRRKETVYQEEKKSVIEKFGCQDDGQDDNQMSAQYSIVKDRIDKKRKKENCDNPIFEIFREEVLKNQEKRKRGAFPDQREICDFIRANGVKNVNSFMFFSYYQARGWRTRDGEVISDWKELVFQWEREGMPK